MNITFASRWRIGERALASFAFAFLLLGSSISLSQEMQSSDLYINKEDFSALRKKALSGNGEAAFKLAHYYEFFENNLQDSFFWGRLSAENGYCKGIYDYISLIEHRHVSGDIGRWKSELNKNNCSK